ncbi:MAG: efflux RND transporter permease subunit [Coriobacteriales bacterium]|jgi:HAE1 family hydrophobic/amphiphilic exporter-1|nr:efflux RND transporter permease subunit [Coriobacteriales bacterium]
MLPRYSVKRPLTIIVAIIAILILGGTSASKMAVTLIPELNLPYAIIVTTVPGASPEEVEQTVTVPVEQTLSTTSGVKTIQSTSSENQSVVFLEFVDDTDMNAVMLEMRENLDFIRDYLPDDARTPIIMRLSMDQLPVAIITVDLEGADRTKLSRLVEDKIAPQYESVPGVASVSTQGLAEPQVEVVLRHKKLDEVNADVAETLAYAGMPDAGPPLTPEMITQVLTAQNFSFPNGYITEDGVDYLIRTGDKYADIEELGDTLLFELPEADIVVTLEDVAEITIVDPYTGSYNRVNGNEAVLITIQKQSESSTAEVASAIHNRSDELMASNPDLRITTLMDQGEYIDMIIGSIAENLLWGVVLAIVVLLLFLHSWKLTGVIALSIPLSLVVALLLMYFSGISLNMLSLSGLALGVGMLVDNSIVVIENIYLKRSQGVPFKEAAIEGARQVSMAISASTFTTCAVFVPFMFSTGLVKQLFVDLALTICYSILASLIVALTFVPMMCSGALRKTRETDHRFIKKAQDIYEVILRWTLNHKAIVLSLVVLIFAGSIYAATQMGTQFFPESDSNQITTELTFPKDSTFEEQVEILDEVANHIQSIEETQTVGTSHNRSSSGMGLLTMVSTSSGSGGDSTNIYIVLKEGHSRSSQDIALEIDTWAADKGYEAESSGAAMDVSQLTGSGIQVVIKGPDLQELRAISEDLISQTSDIEGTIDVQGNWQEPTEEYKITVDKDKAIRRGFTVAQVFQAVAPLVYTAPSVTTIDEPDFEYPVYVSLDNDTGATLEDIKDLELISPQTGETFLLTDIATIEPFSGYESIARNDQTRTVTVSIGIAEGYNVGKVGDEVNQVVAAYTPPVGYQVEVAGEAEEITQAMNDLVLVVILAIAFVYLIMVAQFQSLKYPFIIMFTIPLSAIGMIAALLIAGMALSIVAVVGFVLLVGIVINNGIVLVDYVNQLRAGGMNTRDALIAGGRARLRPIFMTAMTTIFGMTVMALAMGAGSEMSQPIAVAIIGGLLFATLLTLLICPALYELFTGKDKPIKAEDLPAAPAFPTASVRLEESAK